MPSIRFFQQLGLFVQPAFLDGGTCTRMRSAIDRSSWRKGTVARDKALEHLDEEVRKVHCVDIAEDVWRGIRGELLALKPRLEDHFGAALNGCHGPDFLVYEEGAFYTPHLDGGTHYDERRVSLVIFLNGAGAEEAASGYTGGELTFHGLLNGPEWEKCPVPLTGEPGLLVAFRSDTVHEVRPVTAGRRYTIVSWFTA
jgi:SM-20-related protein